MGNKIGRSFVYLVMGFAGLDNAALLAECRRLAAAERRASAELLACLAEVARRHAAEEAGFPSLFDFCVRDLRLSAASAFRRVKAVDVARVRPEIFAMLAAGEVSFTTVMLIAPKLEAAPALLERAKGKTTREVERMVAEEFPDARSAPPDSIRLRSFAAPERPTEESLFSPRIQASQPSSGERPEHPGADPAAVPAAAPAVEAEIHFVAPESFVALVEKLRSLLWHKYPDGGMADILGEAVEEFLRRRDPARPRRRARQQPVDPRARRPPAAVERFVRVRDGERCAFVAADGRRCEQTRGLEVDHVVPWALGGRSDEAANLRLLCRAHNQGEARRLLGGRARDAPS